VRKYTHSSFGWNPGEKRKELFHVLSRFLLIYPGEPEHAAGDLNSPRETRPLGYSMFRFEREDRQNVVYCYELQVSRTARRLGLGRSIMSLLETIGSSTGMKKIMLTTFKDNAQALTFYDSTGFEEDPSSPDFNDDEDDDPDHTEDSEYDYRILSKVITTS